MGAAGLGSSFSLLCFSHRKGERPRVTFPPSPGGHFQPRPGCAAQRVCRVPERSTRERPRVTRRIKPTPLWDLWREHRGPRAGEEARAGAAHSSDASGRPRASRGRSGLLEATSRLPRPRLCMGSQKCQGSDSAGPTARFKSRSTDLKDALFARRKGFGGGESRARSVAYRQPDPGQGSHLTSLPSRPRAGDTGN